MAPSKRQVQVAVDAPIDLTVAPESDDVRAFVFSAHITQLPSRNPALVQQLLDARDGGSGARGGTINTAGAGGAKSSTGSSSPVNPSLAAGGRGGNAQQNDRPGTSESAAPAGAPFVPDCYSIAVELYLPAAAFAAVGSAIAAARAGEGGPSSGGGGGAAAGAGGDGAGGTTGGKTSSSQQQQQPPLAAAEGGQAALVSPGCIPSGWALVGRTEVPSAQQQTGKQGLMLFQQRKIVVPAPNFVKDFLCSELLVAVLTSIPTPIDPAAQHPAAGGGAGGVATNKRTGGTGGGGGAGGTGSGGGGKGKNALAEQVEFHTAVRTFTFNLGPSLFAKKSDVVSFSLPSSAAHGGTFLAHDGPVSNTNNNNNTGGSGTNHSNKISPRHDALMQNSNLDIIPGVEKFTLRLESDGKLLAGRNVRRFPIAFFDIDSMNDVPPPAGTAIDLRAATLSNANATNNPSSNNASNQQNQALMSSRGQPGATAAATTTISAVAAAAARCAPPRVGFMWNGKLQLTQRATWNGAGNKWMFGYSRPLYAPYGTSGADGKSGAALQMLRHLWYNPVEFAIFDGESIADAASPTPTAPPTALARLSLREFVDGDLVCEAAAAVLPERPEVSLALAEMGSHRAKVPHYVAHGTCLRCRVRLTTPLPFPVYVPPVPRPLAPSEVKHIIAPFAQPTANGSNINAACFLTRIVLSLPYRSDMTRNVLRVVYTFLMNHRKSNKLSDVFEVPALQIQQPFDQQAAVAFADDHFQSTVAILANADAGGAAGAGGLAKAGAGGGGATKTSARGTGGGAATGAASPGGAKLRGKDAADGGAGGGGASLEQRGPSVAERAAIAAAHALEDEEYVFHPFGNAERRRVFVSVPDEVSGVEIIDGERRVVIIEGPCPIVAEVAELATDVAGPDLHSLRMLFNYELPFLRRDYHVWPPLVRPLAGQQHAQALDRASASRGSAGTPVQPDDADTQKQGGATTKGALAAGGKQHAQQQAQQPQQPKAKPAGKKGDKSNALRMGTPPPEAKLTPRTLAAQSAKVVTAPSAAASIYVTGPAPLEPLPDLDPGALGGRLRRVRLNCTLQSILRDPRAFLKRSLPTEAIDAATRLATLAGIQSLHAVHPPETMLEALQRGCFPSVSSIVALERALGDCLSTEDVCCEGADAWVPFSSGIDAEQLARQMAQERLAKAQALMREQQLMASHTRDMNAGRLPRVGTVLSFVGIPATAKECARLPPIDTVGEQYASSRKSYMKVMSASFIIEAAETATNTNTSSGERVVCWPCVFPGAALTNQPIRFEITGQVVPCRGPHSESAPVILFVLDCHAYSATSSDHRNPEFDKKKQRDKRIVAPKQFKKMQKAAKLKASQQQGDVGDTNEDGDVERALAGSLRRPECRPDSTTNVVASSCIHNSPTDDEDDEDDCIVDSPPRGAAAAAARNAAQVLVQTDWHLKALSDLQKKSVQRAAEKQQQAMSQAARYQAASELYQRQEDLKRRREAVIESLRSQQMQNRAPFRSHQLPSAKDQNKHPKAPEEGLAPRDRTPQQLSYRGGNAHSSDSDDDDDNGNNAHRRHKLILPPMKFERSVNLFDNGLRLGVFGETEDELLAQRRQREEASRAKFEHALLVDDPIFHVSTRKPRDHPHPVDAMTGSILEGKPLKKSIQQTFAPPPPISLREGQQFGTLQRVDPKKEAHPERRSCIYTKKSVAEPLPPRPKPISGEEKVGPLYGK